MGRVMSDWTLIIHPVGPDGGDAELCLHVRSKGKKLFHIPQV